MSNKDWTGGYHSVYKTLGASNHTLSERADGDYYATDPVASDRLLEVYDVPQYVWECACGAGHLSKRLIEKGRTVFSSDTKSDMKMPISIYPAIRRERLRSISSINARGETRQMKRIYIRLSIFRSPFEAPQRYR